MKIRHIWRNKAVYALISSSVALSGCTTTRYVTRPCIAPDQAIPAEPEHVGDKLTGNAERDFQIVAGSAARLRSWGQALGGIVESCR